MEAGHIHSTNIVPEADAVLPTKFGDFRIRAFRDPIDGKEHCVLYVGDLTEGSPLVRIHSECLTGDAFASLRCDCGPQLHASMKAIQERGTGAIAYMRQEGRGIDCIRKCKPTPFKTPALIPSMPTWRWVYRPMLASTISPPKCSTPWASPLWSSPPTTLTSETSCSTKASVYEPHPHHRWPVRPQQTLHANQGRTDGPHTTELRPVHESQHRGSTSPQFHA